MADLYLRKSDISKPVDNCPTCGSVSSKHKSNTSDFFDLNGKGHTKPVVLRVTYSTFKCRECDKFFNQRVPVGAEGTGYSRFSEKVRVKAIDMYLKGDVTYTDVVRNLWHDYGVRVPPSTMSDWVRKERERRGND